MMGRQNAPEKLFYQFRLEDHVPADHPLRQLDAVLNFDQVRTVLAEHYSPLVWCPINNFTESLELGED